MASQLPVHVAKFGGTSVETPQRVRRVIDLISRGAEGRRVVVSSAFGGITDRLLEAISAAKDHAGDYNTIIAEIEARHAIAIDDLASDDEKEKLALELGSFWSEIRELLEGVRRREASDARTQDAIVSAGERASVPLIAAAFRKDRRKAVALDARTLIRTDAAHGEAVVDFEETNALIRDAFGTIPDDTIAVVTGFIASTGEGVTTTLGRSGSDYTATILAAALGAVECVIWTDVDGVLSADPRLVPEAFTLPRLSYEEAGELAHFGAKVLHPRTMRPLQATGIPLRIKNTMRPEHPGTVIGLEREMTPGRIKAITSVREAALIRLVGTGVLGAPRLTARAFTTLAEAKIDVLLIAQASSEGSLCLAVKESAADAAMTLLERTFQVECGRGTLRLLGEGGNAVIAAVGDFMRDSPGLAGRMFGTLGRARVNVRAIAQGASEHNISAVIADEDAALAVQALHESFALRRTRAHIFVIGTGGLGTRLLDLLKEQVPSLCDEHRLNLRLVGLADTRRMVFDESGMPFDEASAGLSGNEEADLDLVVTRLAEARVERLIVVDATPSEAVAKRHAELLRAGIAVVTPNKAATLVNVDEWKEAQEAARSGEVPYYYETTVGAGLGIVATVRDLLRTGDEIAVIEGVLSGTLSFIFNAMQNGTTFSAAILEARELGYTEPDPRDDLSGRDVTRKLILLAREMGLNPAPSMASVESLIPEELQNVATEEFLKNLQALDSTWNDRIVQAGGSLQYIARLDADGNISAGVETIQADSPFAGLKGSSIAVAFHTKRYSPEPLVIRGPGASADITAAVLLADIVRAAEAMH